MRPGFAAAAALILLLAVALMLSLALRKHAAPAMTKHFPVAAAPGAATPTIATVSFSEPVVPKRVARTPAASAAPIAPLPPQLLSPRQLVDELAKIGKGPISAEQAARFKADFKELIRRGAASVPAIKGFLEQELDVAFGDIKGGSQLGYSSLRSSLIDALNQIGGPQAQAAMLETMNSTAVPGELLQLAQDLDKQAPGQYNDQIVSGAQQTLAMASAGQLGTNTELGPVYRALQNYGTPNTTADAANTDPVDFYNAVQLANMPDGQGLSSLLQMEQASGGDSQFIATEMIAQMAGQNGDALDAFAQLAQNGQISQSEWVQLAPILGGDQYQMNASDTDYTVVPGATSPQEIQQRIDMINTFMNLVPPGTGGAKALQQELGALAGKMGN